jgi:predicted aldo/keto reductase-like oxidoreductase
MDYRNLGKTGFKASALGFGAMRLPINNKKAKNINGKETEKMVVYAIENGINYFDTAYIYHEGMSETVLGKIFKKNKCRDKIKIATKMPCWIVETYDDFDKYLDEQLKKLKTDFIDFYLLHGLFSERWNNVYNLNVLSWAEKAIQKGKIGQFGFSFHDSFEVFKRIIDSYEKWSFCLLQYNYIGENVQAGRKGLEYASGKNISVIVMEPLLGGMLADPPGHIKSILDENNINPVKMALRWLWDQKEISTVLSGMSNFEQVKQNIEFAKNSKVNNMTQIDKEMISLVQKKYKEYHQIPCTKCRYCLPCPNEVDIPRNLELYNESNIHLELSKAHYNYHTPEKFRASSCLQCGICEEKCPQKIKISELMPVIHEKLVFKF